MAYFLYNTLLHAAILLLIPYFLLKMLTSRKYREGIPERFGFIRKRKLRNLGKGRVVWVHAVSVGETKAVLPVVRLLKRRRPDMKILFSTVTATGQRTAEKEGKGLIDALIYYPLDLSWSVRRAISLVKPSLFIVVEKEIWPNAFRAMRKAGAPVVVVNGTVSDKSAGRFRRLSFLFRGVFSGVSLFLARTGEDMEKAVSIGVPEDRVELAGNLKFDLSPPSTAPRLPAELKEALGKGPGTLVITAGSTHPGEEEMVLSAFRELKGKFQGLRLVLAPRHPERFNEVESIIRKSGLAYARRSGKAGGGGAEVVLLDTIGELMTVYSLSDVAIVGGSLVPGIGGHNLLEPAYYGVPVVYGPHLAAYLGMAELLEKEGGGIRAGGDNGLGPALEGLLSNEVLRKRTGRKARGVVEENRGASERAASAIERLLRSLGCP